MKRSTTRTIVDGRVLVDGRYFYPEDKHMEYDGRLDGLRYHFGRYYVGDKPTNLISMIRQVDSPVGFDPDNPASYSENRPEIIDGGLPWLFWKAVD